MPKNSTVQNGWPGFYIKDQCVLANDLSSENDSK